MMPSGGFRFGFSVKRMAARRAWSRGCVLLMISGTLLGFTACSKEPVEKEPVVSVQAAPAEKTKLQETVTVQAILFPMQQATITPKINAPVRKFLVNRGSKVHEGQLLAVLENRDLMASSEENKGGLE